MRLKLVRTLLVIGMFVMTNLAGAAMPPQILVEQNAGDLQQYAARELQRYLHQTTGQLAEIVPADSRVDRPSFVLGVRGRHPLLAQWAAEGHLRDVADLGPQGYALKRLQVNGHPTLTITGADAEGALYGVYGLMEDYYGVAFYYSGDVLPTERQPLMPPALDEHKTPLVEVRGMLPWTNFPQSATVYSLEDWKFIIDQTARMRMNFIHIHNYTGALGHNEMYHNFELDGVLSRVWMATVRSGHGWACPPWDLREYRFGARDLFGDYDFGSDAALHNETLDNRQVFDKGRTLFQQAIAHAHRRGVRIGLGLDIDNIPEVYEASAHDPEVIDARVAQIATDYPTLDYLLCFQSEAFHAADDLEQAVKDWQDTVVQVLDGLREHGRSTRVGVAGWGIKADAVEDLPEEIICAPISPYSDQFEDGSIYGDREYWGCPWLERDFNSSQYYYPYTMHLSRTIEAWQRRAPNMNGFYTLSWRLTDAVEAKMAYIAKAPWDLANRYDSSYDVYHEYATLNYGEKAADSITEIINENEPYAGGFGECQHTPEFSGNFRMPTSSNLANVYQFRLMKDAGEKSPMRMASEYDRGDGVNRANAPEGGEVVGFIAGGDWFSFGDVEFNSEPMIEVRVAARSDCAVELRLDGPEGPLLGMVEIKATGGFQAYDNFTGYLRPIEGRHRLVMKMLDPEVNDLPKAEAQLQIIDRAIAEAREPGDVRRLEYLRRRIAAAADFIWLNRYYPHLDWGALPHRFGSWAGNFIHRVNDISSLGNVTSTQNRFVQLNYLPRVKEMRQKQLGKSAWMFEARGTPTGAKLTWRPLEPELFGYRLYRNHDHVADLPPDATSYVDTFDGQASYHMITFRVPGKRYGGSTRPARCVAGEADQDPPQVVVVSPPVSGPVGEPAHVTARVLDNRAHEFIEATLVYRRPGEADWERLPMTRRVRAIFGATIPGEAIDALGVEYYIEAHDGDNTGYFPAEGGALPLRLTAWDGPEADTPRTPRRLQVELDEEGRPSLSWRPRGEAPLWYRVYRSHEEDFEAGPATFVCYLPGSMTEYVSNGWDFDADPMKGEYHFRITAVNRDLVESEPTRPVSVVVP